MAKASKGRERRLLLADQRIAARVYGRLAEIHGNIAMRDALNADRRDAARMLRLNLERTYMARKQAQAYGHLTLREWIAADGFDSSS